MHSSMEQCSEISTYLRAGSVPFLGVDTRFGAIFSCLLIQNRNVKNDLPLALPWACPRINIWPTNHRMGFNIWWQRYPLLTVPIWRTTLYNGTYICCRKHPVSLKPSLSLTHARVHSYRQATVGSFANAGTEHHSIISSLTVQALTFQKFVKINKRSLPISLALPWIISIFKAACLLFCLIFRGQVW